MRIAPHTVVIIAAAHVNFERFDSKWERMQAFRFQNNGNENGWKYIRLCVGQQRDLASSATRRKEAGALRSLFGARSLTRTRARTQQPEIHAKPNKGNGTRIQHRFFLPPRFFARAFFPSTIIFIRTCAAPVSQCETFCC